MKDTFIINSTLIDDTIVKMKIIISFCSTDCYLHTCGIQLQVSKSLIDRDT